MQLINIGFVPFGDLSLTPSTRIRVKYVMKYLKNSRVSSNPKDLFDCDVIVFQKRYKEQDTIDAKQFKSLGNKKVIFDLTDPVWDEDYPAVYFPITGDNEEYFEKMVYISDCMTFCTQNLLDMFKEKFSHQNTKVWLDRMDLELHQFKKVHKIKERYTILFHASRFNLPSVELARAALEEIGEIYDIDFVVVADFVKSGVIGYYKIAPFKNVKLITKQWSENRVIEELEKSDISINPHIKGKQSYKSNNKTVKSLALGVPCVEENFYSEIKFLLDNCQYREQMAAEGRELVEQKYNVKISVNELLEIMNGI